MMEVEESNSFDFLLKDFRDFDNIETVLPILQNCFTLSNNETEILRAVEVAFGFCLKILSVDELDEKLFKYACPAAKKVFINKVSLLENVKTDSNAPQANIVKIYFQLLDTCLKIISFFSETFVHFNEIPKISILHVCSFLANLAEVLCTAFFHFKLSETVYDSYFDSLADCLSNFFKKCCVLEEQFLNFLTDKLLYEPDEEKAEETLVEVLRYLGKSGIALINLEAKTMIKVWKSYFFLVEKYFPCQVNMPGIGETINSLCSNLEILLSLNSHNEDVGKSIKLSCFILKLIIKFCEIFSGCIKSCQNSLLSVLLTLCRLQVAQTEQIKNINQDLVHQVTCGIDPLLSQLMPGKILIEQCSKIVQEISYRNNKSLEFSFLCCYILKKLIHCDTATRNLWFSEDNNILEWLFRCISFYQFHICWNGQLSNILVSGKQKSFTDLYEYILVTTSAFAMTMSAVEFYLLERTLIKNLLQSNLLRALLASDIWCLLARFADSNLCLVQLQELCSMLRELEGESLRVEKYYLRFLILRLIPLLSETQRETFLKSLQPSFCSELWGGIGEFSEINDFTLSEGYYINSSIMDHMSKLLNQNEMLHESQCQMGKLLGNGNVVFEKLEGRIINLWKFDCESLSRCSKRTRFLKMVCALTAYIIPEMSSGNLFTVLQKMKKLLTFVQEPVTKLYLTMILNSLSTVRIPSGEHRQNIIAAIAEMFRELLLTEEVIVKQKTLETFYCFSHVTSHGEIIPLTVQNSPALKTEVANYFKRKLPDQPEYNVNDYLCKLQEAKYNHVCLGRRVEGFADCERLNFKKFKKNSMDAQEVINRWRQDGEKIVKSIHLITEQQKREIKELSTYVLSLIG